MIRDSENVTHDSKNVARYSENVSLDTVSV
jgi:hypothetical protein